MYKTFLITLLLSLLVPVLIFVDFKIINGNCGEYGIVEIAQEVIILILSVYSFVSLKKVLGNIAYGLGAFFLLIFIRELDFLFDNIYHGAWFVIALVSMAICVIKYYLEYIKTSKFKELKKELKLFAQTKDFNLFGLGIVIVLIFSRIMGTGSLWKVILDENYDRIIKTVIQEGVELYGYGIALLALLSISSQLKKYAVEKK